MNRRALSSDGTFVMGAVADAPPVIARETPAAPNAKAALPRLRMELRFACVMVSLRVSVSTNGRRSSRAPAGRMQASVYERANVR
jgi:hypothetical protein